VIVDTLPDAEKKWDKEFAEICRLASAAVPPIDVRICTNNGVGNLLINEGIAEIRDGIAGIHIVSGVSKFDIIQGIEGAGETGLLIDNDTAKNPNEGDAGMKSELNNVVEITGGNGFWLYNPKQRAVVTGAPAIVR
jgi:hypothetical protein